MWGTDMDMCAAAATFSMLACVVQGHSDAHTFTFKED